MSAGGDCSDCYCFIVPTEGRSGRVNEDPEVQEVYRVHGILGGNFFHHGMLNAVGVMLPSLADYRMAFLWTKTSCILAKISESTALHTLGSRIPSTS